MKDAIRTALLNISKCGALPKDLRVINQVVDEYAKLKSKITDNASIRKSLTVLKEKLDALEIKLKIQEFRATTAEQRLGEITERDKIPQVIKERDDLKKSFEETVEAKDLIIAGLNDVVDYQKEKIGKLEGQLNRHLADILNLEKGRCDRGHSSYHSYDFTEFFPYDKKGCFGCDFDSLQGKYYNAVDALKMMSGVASRTVKQLSNNKLKVKSHTSISSNEQLKTDLIKSIERTKKVLEEVQDG